MSICKGDVLWSNINHDNFIVCGTTVTLHKVEKTSNLTNKAKCIPLSATTSAVPLYTCPPTDIHYMKCVALYPKPDYPNLLAVGQVIGKVALTNIGDSKNGDLVGKEFAQRHSRQCNYLAWNPIESNFLAAGLEKNRHDGCIAIWDVNSKVAESSLPPERMRYSSSESSVITKPYLDIGMSESSISFCWKPGESKTFVTGMSKCLRVYDMREPSKPQISTQTKGLYGVTIDPLFPDRVVSFTENQVFVWNLRSLLAPEITISEVKPVQKVSWCPTRSGFLSILCKDSCSIRHCDIIHTSTESDNLEPTYIQRYSLCEKNGPISSFAWHLSEENRFLTITPNSVLSDVKIFNRITLDWSNEFALMEVSGKYKEEIRLPPELESKDIGMIMKERALNGYGMEIDKPGRNAKVVFDDQILCRLWTWMALSKELSKDKMRKSAQNSFYGVESVLSNLKSEKTAVNWQGLEASETRAKYLYRSEERFHALQMCGWGNLQDPNGLNKLLEKLQSECAYERAAAIALFNLQIKRSLAILNTPRNADATEDSDPNSSLGLVGMALAGFTENKDALWQKMCSSFRQQLTNPYLRAMFFFLSSPQTDNYMDVLNEKGMAVCDRVAFACTFLPDNKLEEYINNLSSQLTDAGDLDGILLTGLSEKGVKLLQNYVDLTSDVQTASFIAISTFPSNLSSDSRVDSWIHGYRSLLNQWKLWKQRALFDIVWQGSDSVNHVQSEVFVSCHSCRKSVSRNIQPLMKNKQQSWTRSSNTAKHVKVSCCPHCRNPLPRCALCLKHLGTASGAFSIESGPDSKSSPFDNWFTWCQSCHHGGHAGHVMDWFKDHSDCPVAGCSCKCMASNCTSRT